MARGDQVAERRVEAGLLRAPRAPIGRVEVEARAALLARQAGLLHAREHVARVHALAVGRVQRGRGVRRDVEADLVEQLERAHRHAEVERHGLERGRLDALLEQAHGLVEVGPEQRG